jgi:hypothetical protein
MNGSVLQADLETGVIVFRSVFVVAPSIMNIAELIMDAAMGQ